MTKKYLRIDDIQATHLKFPDGQVQTVAYLGSNGPKGDTGYTGSQGATGPQGQSASYYQYQANIGSNLGDPGTGYVIWNNATQVSATSISISHLTNGNNNVDIDIFLSLVQQGNEIIIQDANNSNNYQKWIVNGTPTTVANSYWTFPVSLSAGTASFTNNQQIIVAIAYVSAGATGPQGAIGYTGSAGADGAVGYTGSAGMNGSNGTNGYTGSAGMNGSVGATGPIGYTGSAGTGGGGTGNAIISGSKNFTIDSSGNITSNIVSEDSTASTVTLYNSPATLSIYNGTDNGTLNIGSGVTASGKTININFGTNGASGSTTNINIGSAVDGANNVTLVSGNFRAEQIAEACVFVTPTPVSNVVTFDCLTGQVFELTMTNISANFTMNLTNLNLGSGFCTTVTIILKQGSTGYYCSGLQIGGVAQTLGTNFFWQGGSTPTGTANKRDVIAFNIMNNGGTYTTYAQLVTWG